MREIKDDWPLWRRAGLLFDKPRRRAFRLFRTFPSIPYRTVVDLGAYRGEFTDAALAILRPERVLLIEADPQSATRLEAQFAKQPACRVVQAAVTDRRGPVRLRINERRDSSSVLPIADIAEKVFGTNMGEVDEVDVPGLTLDELFAEQGLGHVELLKVDIQGAEGMMIAGGKAALAGVRGLYIEVCFEEFYEGSPRFRDLHASLTELGFKLRSLHECRLGTDACLAYANALYWRVTSGA